MAEGRAFVLKGGPSRLWTSRSVSGVGFVVLSVGNRWVVERTRLFSVGNRGGFVVKRAESSRGGKIDLVDIFDECVNCDLSGTNIPFRMV